MIINSRLDGFVLIDTITELDSNRLAGRKQFRHAPLYLGIESLAQLGAYHVRFLTDFEKHAFLLGIRHCTVPSGKELHGPFRLFGNILGKSSSAYSYGLKATGDDAVEIEGEFLFAAVDYTEAAFKRDILRDHYRKVFSCLKNSSKTDC
jgi:hypothetical protein